MDAGSAVGAVALAVVLVVVAVVTLVRRRFDGRVRPSVRPTLSSGGFGQNRHAGEAADHPALAEFGIDLPAGRPHVVQFSGEFCSTCPQTRTLVTRVLADQRDVGYVDIDVADHLDAVRTLQIRRTPTLLITDRLGEVTHRISGMPREAELRLAVEAMARLP